MRTIQNFRQGPSPFTSAKNAAAIPVTHNLVRDALVQAALDPEIRAIEFIPKVVTFDKIVALDAIVFRSAGGRQLLDIPEARPLRSVDEEGLALLAADKLGLPALRLSAADIRSQPRAANSSLVWNCRHARVQISDRVRLLQALSEDGPMPLARLSSEVRWGIDPVATVLALACLDLLELDLTTIPVGPETTVRRRMAEGETL